MDANEFTLAIRRVAAGLSAEWRAFSMIFRAASAVLFARTCTAVPGGLYAAALA